MLPGYKTTVKNVVKSFQNGWVSGKMWVVFFLSWLGIGSQFQNVFQPKYFRMGEGSGNFNLDRKTQITISIHFPAKLGLGF